MININLVDDNGTVASAVDFDPAGIQRDVFVLLNFSIRCLCSPLGKASEQKKVFFRTPPTPTV